MANTETEDQQITMNKPRRVPILLASSAIFFSMLLVALDRLFLPGRFSVNEVVVAGYAPDVDPAQVLGAVKGMGPTSWFSVDLAEVEQVVKTVPWVYGVEVRRKWPGKLIVNLSQADPVANWNRAEWLNAAGEKLVMPEAFTDDRLPRLFGPMGRQLDVLHTVISLTAHMPATWRLEEVTLTDRGVWSAMLKISNLPNLITVRLGKQDLEKRLKRLIQGVELIQSDDLKNFREFDLRYPNGFAARFNATANGGNIVGKIKNRDRQDG